jgi:hypothetical protein
MTRVAVRLVLALAMTAALVSCGLVATDIASITSRPGDYLGREVTVSGTVGDAVKLPLLPGAYSIKDETGEILVVTKDQPPPSGSRLRLRGRVESAATLGSRVLGLHLAELHRY